MGKSSAVLVGLLSILLPHSLNAYAAAAHRGEGEASALAEASSPERALPAWQRHWEAFGPSAALPDRDLFHLALEGYGTLLEEGRLDNPRYLTVVDFSRPSTDKRLWVLDLEQHRVAFHTWVAHGVASGERYAERFSDTPKSHQSSLGFYLAAEPYDGKHGLSLRLDGLEPGFNGNARDRDIVLHGADYATPGFLARNGRLGRSQGCPSVPPALSGPIIDAIQGNSCLFVFAPDSRYLERSPLLGGRFLAQAD